MSIDSRNLISSILRQEPLDRLSIKQILSHEWFTRPCMTSPFPADYFQSMDMLPGTIPEETGSPAMEMLGEGGEAFLVNDPHQPELSEGSTASTSSWHSASYSDVGLGIQGSRSNTPITSDESEEVRKYSPGSKDKGKAVDRGGMSGNRIHRNPSQTTITKSESLLSMTRQTQETPMMTRSESGFRFPPPSPSMLDSLPHGSPSLPIPAHSRTPSRTKRRSIGSTISERMLPSNADPALPSYLSMLSLPTPAPFSTAAEKQLLEALSLIGFDTGQMIHSVQNDACDASGAIWWMLALKAEARDADMSVAPSGSSQKSSSATSIAQTASPLRSTLPQDMPTFDPNARPDVRNAPTNNTQMPASAGDPNEELVQVRQNQSTLPLQEGVVELIHYGAPAHTPSPRKPRALTTAGVRMSSISAPSFSPNLNTNSRGSPTPKPEDSVLTSSSQDRQASSAKATEEKKPTSFEEVQNTEKPQVKPRSASVSTVSMLQRATSALGVSTSRKGPQDETSLADGKVSSAETGRSTASLLGTGLFGRKVSSSGAVPEKPALIQRLSKEGLISRPNPTGANLRPGSPSPDLAKGTLVDKDSDTSMPLDSPAQDSPPLLSQDGPGALSQISVGSPGRSESPKSGFPGLNENPLRASTVSAKSARSSKNLFTSFRQWFNDDRRKQKRHRQSSAPLGLDTNNIQRTGSLRRSAVHAPSPLKRPPLARVPSNVPSSAGVSRRSSSTSARHMSLGDQPSPLLGHSRRRSDASRHSLSSISGARTPTSDRGDRGGEGDRERDLSRPASSLSGAPVSSEAYNAARKRHGRASSTSSAGSRHSTMIAGSPVAAYRRTPAVTQVRRLSAPRNEWTRHSQSRNHSNPSSIHTNDSRRSSVSTGADGENDIIEEENENTEDAVDAERSRVLQKLSGSTPPLSQSPNGILGAPPDTLAPPPSAERRPSSEVYPQPPQKQLGHARDNTFTSPAHVNTIFLAHKVVNPFGTPNGSHFQSSSTSNNASQSRSGREQAKPKLRDVFRNKKADGEADWVDEDEGLETYSGGFGQGSARPASSMSAGQKGWGNSLGAMEEETAVPPSVLGEGRYAGIGLTRDDVAPGNVVSWRAMPNARGPAFKRAAIVEEEEEEEDDGAE